MGRAHPDHPKNARTRSDVRKRQGGFGLGGAMSFRLHSTIVVLSTIIALLAPLLIAWLSPFANAWLANNAEFEIGTSFNVLGVYPCGLLVGVTCLSWPFISFMPALLLDRF